MHINCTLGTPNDELSIDITHSLIRVVLSTELQPSSLSFFVSFLSSFRLFFHIFFSSNYVVKSLRNSSSQIELAGIDRIHITLGYYVRI